MEKKNKAHTATANRIAKLYGTSFQSEADKPDIQTELYTIEVETTATLADAIQRLSGVKGKVYVAATNKEGVLDALNLVGGTKVGVMDPRGNILRESRGG
jgi:prophage tail gpP-like protein